MILPILFGCEIWSLILRHMGRQRVFKFMVLRSVFECKRKE